MNHTPVVALEACPDYTVDNVRAALSRAIEAAGGLDWVRAGMKVGIKLNLCGALKPEEAATTHPVLAAELTKMLLEKGAQVILGDSPGGPFTAAYIERVYSRTGMSLAEKAGGVLNRDWTHVTREFPEGVSVKSFAYVSWLNECDAVINFCKLKSHGLMGMTAAVKNLYGVIPGTVKSEYHFLHTDPLDFANMLVDLNESIRPVLHLVDAVEIMEGNGPTKGTPRHMGALFASSSPYAADRVCAGLLGIKESEILYLTAAVQRGLLPENGGYTLHGNPEPYYIQGFKRSGATASWFLPSPEDPFLRKTMKKGLAYAMRSKPALKGSCIACGRCVEMCPAHAIEIRDKKAHINRRKCVRCFCCQEFCPAGAMQVQRTLIARLLEKN